jgi:methoxymalonate biosynthesis protein
VPDRPPIRTAVPDRPGSDLAALVDELVGDRAGAWDTTGVLPDPVLRGLGGAGVLCAQVSVEHAGLGYGSRRNGDLTAHVGTRCGSLRSVMTSQGMAAWTVARLGTSEQRAGYLPRLVGGELAAVAFSEAGAGSDLSTMRTEARMDGGSLILDGQKVWITGAAYADLLVVFARFGDAGTAVVVPARAPGVTIERVPEPLGCRAAGHATVRLDRVRVPQDAVLGGRPGQSLPLLVTIALAYGRLSVAWGCVGILRACLAEVTAHARTRRQFDRPLAEHQLVARHLADLFTAERVASQACAAASASWDGNSPDLVTATVLAKYVASTAAARGAAAAVQVLASAGARDGHPVARAYRDAKLMEIIEGSNEICQLMLARQAVTAAA